MKPLFVRGGFAAIACGAMLFAACGGNKDAAQSTMSKVAPGGSKDQSKWPADDQTKCGDWRRHPELEVEETEGPGAYRPNVRRIYKWSGSGDNRGKVLICREIDTNLDGIKDVVRTFDEKTGDPAHEEADRNYDGKVDDWVDFLAGRMAKEAEDTRNTGAPDVCKFYNAQTDGLLYKARRNTHCAYPKIDCRVEKPTSCDTWEIYQEGALIRIGSDANCDGHIDRWDRDTQKLAAQAAAAALLVDAGSDASTNDGGTASDGGN